MATFNPTQDCMIDAAQPSFNFGASDPIDVLAISGKSGNKQRALLTFDVSSWGGGAPDSAVLALHNVFVNGAGVAFSVYRMTQAWVEGTKNDAGPADGATWNTRDGTNAWTTPGGDFTTTGGLAFVVPAGDASLDVTTLVQDAIANRAGIVSVILKLDNESPASSVEWSFSSKENATPANRPVLTVTLAGGTGMRRRGGVV